MSELMDKIYNINNTEEYDKYLDEFNEIMKVIMNKCFRTKSINHKPTVSWFDNEVKKQRNKVSALYKRKFRNLENVEYADIYKRERLSYKKLIKRKKKDSWMKFCSKSTEVFGDVFKYVRKKNFNFTDIIFSTFESSSVFDTFDEVALQLMETHFSIESDNAQNAVLTQEGGQYTENDFRPVSGRELGMAINSQNMDKAPGYDLIDGRVTKQLYLYNKKFLFAIFNKALQLSYFPKTWKRGKAIFFRKKNRSLDSPRAYRPITLLPVLAKVLERIIRHRLVTILENTGYFDDNQFGFREGKNTMQAVKKFKNMTRTIENDFKYCAIISFDVEGAFDSINWDVIYNILDELPIPIYLIKILKNYLTNRQIGFTYLEGSKWYDIYKGTPQGSCLGPVLWLLVADKILKQYRRNGEYILAYADDFLIMEGANTRRGLELKVNNSIKIFNDICTSLKLKISTSKTTSMILRNKLYKRKPQFKLGISTIKVADSISYLGLIIDNRYTWLQHFESLRNKIISFTNQVNRVWTSDTGINCRIRKIWYNAVIHGQLQYGYECWLEDLKEAAIKRLSSCQRNGLFSVINPYKNIST